MTDTPEDTTAELPPELIERVDELSQAQLRELAEYAGRQISEDHESTIEQIEARDGEEIVRKVDRQGYVEVVKTQECSEGCPDCPHGPYLYHVSPEPQIDGENDVHWEYIGRVRE